MPFGISTPDLGDIEGAAGSTFRRAVKTIKKPARRVVSDIEDQGHRLKQGTQRIDRSIFGSSGLRKNIGDVRKLLKQTRDAVNGSKSGS